MIALLYFSKFQFRRSNNRQWRLRRLDCASEQADPNEDGDHADAGGLENCAKEGREAFWPQRTPSFCVWGRTVWKRRKRHIWRLSSKGRLCLLHRWFGQCRSSAGLLPAGVGTKATWLVCLFQPKDRARLLCLFS